LNAVRNLLFSPKIRLAFILPTLTALAVSIPLIWYLLSGLLQQGAATQLLHALPVVTGLVEEHLALPPEALQAEIADLAGTQELRLTIVDQAGTVLADNARSRTQVQAMDNHADRPEIAAARAQGSGSSVRRSATTGLVYVYAARTLADQDGRLFTVRLAQPVQGLQALRRELALVLIVATTAALMAMTGWLWWLQRQISRVAPELLESAKHLENGDFSYRIRISPQTELGRLGRFLNRIADQADRQIQHLTTQREHLLTVVSSMREGVLVTDEEGFTRLANPAFCRFFGISGEVEGRTPLELTRQTRLEDLIVSTLTTGEPALAEIDAQFPKVRTIALATASLGKGVGAVLVARDITDLVLLGQMRRDFVANVSHELKTPLTAIRGYAETLRYGEIDNEETVGRFLDRILQQCARLQALLEDLLTLSRLESLEDGSERSPIQLDNLLQECLASIAPQVTEKQIELEVESRSKPIFHGDRDALERLVINLLDNAVKYNRVGGRVRADLLQREEEIVFEVSDTGIGIPADSLNRVFERFYRVDKGRSRDEGGTGLGLAIVKHVAQLHGGRVEVESHLGEGSTFRVHLPTHAD
jgi:two-component system phosphate regulon sensor histidine kinase PhoR